MMASLSQEIFFIVFLITFIFQKSGFVTNMRRRRHDEFPNKVEITESIAHYKQHPVQFLPHACPPPLYTSTCDKCCSQGESYIVDNTSRILGEVDITSQSSANDSLSLRLVRMCVSTVYSEGVLVSPGQLEVLRTAVSSGAVVVMSLTDCEGLGPVSDVLLQALALLSHRVTPTMVSVRDIEAWGSWPLTSLGLDVAHEDETDLTNMISKGGLMITGNLALTLHTLMDKCFNKTLLVVPASVSHDLCHSLWGGHRARLDVGLPMSVREIIGNHDWGVAEVVSHCNIIGRRQRRVTPSQLVVFVVKTKFNDLNREELIMTDLSKAVQEMISLLETRGAVMSFSGKVEDAVTWAVKRLGGQICSGRVFLDFDDESIWKLCQGMETYFLCDFAVSVGVMASLKESVRTSRPGVRTRDQSVTVGHQEVMDTAVTVLQLLAEDRASILPCEDLTQGVMEAIFKAEAAGSLVNVSEDKGSQYGAELSERAHNRYGWRHGDEEEWEAAGEREDTRLVVGHTQEGSDWLDWTARLMRHRLKNLYITLLVLYNNANTEIFSLIEVDALVKAEVERRKKKGWKESCMVGVSEITRKSVTALDILGLIQIFHKEQLGLVKVTRPQDIMEMIQVVLEFRC